MKKKISVLLVLCFIISSFSFSATADFSDDIISTEDFGNLSAENTVEYVPNEIVLITNYLVDLSQYEGNGPFDFNGVSITDIEPLFFERTEEEIAARIERRGEASFTYCITTAKSVEIKSALATLNSSPYIKCAEPNYICEDEEIIISSVNTQNSTLANTATYTQWAHTDLQMDDVWGMGFVGSSNLTVAVVDVAFEAHVDLENNINMSLAYDSHNDNTIVNDGFNIDTNQKDNTHGNMVSGIIGADYDDVGVNGICKNVNIIPIQSYTLIGSSQSNQLHYSSLCIAFEYAADEGAKIINLSQALPYVATTLRQISQEEQILVVAAAGNNNSLMENASDVIGQCNDNAYWIVVGSIERNDVRRHTSNWSKRYCDLFAPGAEIASTVQDNEYDDNCSGTSAAAPHVAAACALIMAKATHLTPIQVKDYILDNVTVLDSLENLCVTNGKLNIKAAVTAIYNEDRSVYENYTKGDINNDGKINVTDYTVVKSMYNGSYNATAAQINAADINGNGRIDITDYLLIQRYYYKTYYFPPI